MRLVEINEKFERTKEQLSQLDIDYKDKTKGESYIKRKSQLIAKMGSLKRKALETGTSGSICHVTGILSRPSKKNPAVMVQEKFNLYFTNTEENEVPVLIRLHIKSIVSYTVTFIPPGIIMTSS
jgi:hypothetical protein